MVKIHQSRHLAVINKAIQRFGGRQKMFLAWGLCVADLVVPMSRNVVHVKENLKVVDLSFTEEEILAISEAAGIEKYRSNFKCVKPLSRSEL